MGSLNCCDSFSLRPPPFLIQMARAGGEHVARGELLGQDQDPLVLERHGPGGTALDQKSQGLGFSPGSPRTSHALSRSVSASVNEYDSTHSTFFVLK